MCTLAIYFRQCPSLPLVVAANRDEFYERPASEPRVIAHDPWIVAGQDLSAGGTWLGTNEHGMVVGVLNRRNPDGPDPRRRSRGLLCLEALRARNVGEVVARLEREPATVYNWFNLLVAEPERSCVVSNAGDRIQVTELPPGVHVLTNLTLNDPTCPRIAKSRRLFEKVPISVEGDDAGPLLSRLRAILSDHSPPLARRPGGALGTLCIHTPGYGTRSSSVLMHIGSPGRVRYWHAAGPPCENDFSEVCLPNLRFAGQRRPE